MATALPHLMVQEGTDALLCIARNLVVNIAFEAMLSLDVAKRPAFDLA